MNANHILKLTVALLLLIGCSTPKGLERRSERLKIAHEKKGVYIPKDTVRQIDTLETIEYRNDTVILTRSIIKTLEPVIEYKTKREVRYETKYKYKTVKVENRAMVDSLQLVLRQERQKTKQTRIENRKSKWWLWLLIGIAIGFLLPYAHKIMSYAKKTPLP